MERPAGMPRIAANVLLPLSAAQIGMVVQQITGQAGSRESLIGEIDDLRLAVTRLANDPKLNRKVISRSTLTALRVWTAFSAAGPDRGVKDLASELEMSPSSIYRYVNTFVELRLLERTAKRRYRLLRAESRSSSPSAER